MVQPENNQISVEEARRKTAKLFVDVLLKRIRVLDALKKMPKNIKDPSLSACFHILVHYDADEDLRKKDPLYKEVQDDFFVETAETLAKGEPLPVNIIKEYKDFYGKDLLYNEKEVIERLAKKINL